ncbi:MAG: TIGR01777 family oxidoreductase [Fimbriiglobus sp.]
MARFTLRSEMPVTAAELYDWHSRPATFQRLAPPWEKVWVVGKPTEFGDGHRVTLRAKVLGPIHKDWVAELSECIPGQQFKDTQLSGPFAEWVHTHRMIADGPTSWLEDDIQYRLPLGFLGRIFGSGLVKSKLTAMFRYRHWLTSSDLRRQQQYAHHPRLTVGITGSNGLIGNALAYFLGSAGHTVVRFVRQEPTSPYLDGSTTRLWNPNEPCPQELLTGLDSLIHLAGDGIAEGRWTTAKKARIRESRVTPTQHLAQAVADAKLSSFLSASAVGYYGDAGDTLLDEDAPVGQGFLAEICRDWETATMLAVEAGIRTMNLRIGVVQTPQGAALGKQLTPFSLGVGAVLGSGKQWVSWITLNDLIAAIQHCLLTPSLQGPVNLVAPEPVTNRDYGRELASVLRRPFLFTIPRPVLKILFGEMAEAALLASMKAIPKKLIESGFVFDHPTLTPALRNLLGKG